MSNISVKTSVTSVGQIRQIAQMLEATVTAGRIKRAVKKAVAIIDASPNGNAQRVITQGNSLSDEIILLIEQKIVEYSNKIEKLRRIVELDLDKGSRIPIDLDVSGFDNYQNKKSNVQIEPKKNNFVQVYEVTQNGTYSELFGCFGKNPDHVCFSQTTDILTFIYNHTAWLSQEGHGNFFLFKVEDIFYVANICLLGGKWDLGVRKFDDNHIWHASDKHRIIIPAL